MDWLGEVIEATLFAAIWQHRKYPTKGPMWESWCRIRTGVRFGKLDPLFERLEEEVRTLERDAGIRLN